MKRYLLFLIFSGLFFMEASCQIIDIEVEAMLPTKGKVNSLLLSTDTITSRIRNNSATNQTNIPVTLTITGANPYSVVQTIPNLNPATSVDIIFTGVPINSLGNQTVTVSVPNDSVNTNNSIDYIQDIYCDTVSHTNNSPIINGVGYNTAAGIIANRFVIPSNGLPMQVKAVGVTIALGADNVGNTIVGVLLDASGTIVDSTNAFVMGAGDLGTKATLNYLDGTVDYAGQTVYVGFRQIANPNIGFFPCATQTPTIDVDSTFYGFGVNGGTGTIYTNLGAWMIDAVVQPEPFAVSSNAFGNVLCSGSQLNLTATPSGYDNFDFNIDATIAQTGNLNTYSYAPTTTTDYTVTASKNACTVSIPTTTVTVVNEINTSIDALICDGENYQFGAQVLTTAGIYIDTITSTGGCDSIVNLDLSVNQPSGLDIYDTICEGDTYFFINQNVSAQGIYSYTTTNSQSCDSVITLYLEVDEVDYTINASICQGETYNFGNQTLSSSGTYYMAAPNPNGCDTLITLELSVEQFVTTVTQNVDTLVADATGPNITYQWIDCSDNSPVAGATNQWFKPGVTGNYAVIITQNDCSRTSDCFFIDYTGIDEAGLIMLNLFPNPVSNTLNLETGQEQMTGFIVYDVEGRVVISDVNLSGTTQLKISTEALEQGTYIVKVIFGDNSVRKLFVKE